jgi:glutathione S-transferase
MLQSHNGKFLVEGDAPTVADCLAIPFLRGFTRGHIDHIPTTCLDDFPAVVEYIKNCCALEGVKGRYQNGLY